MRIGSLAFGADLTAQNAIYRAAASLASFGAQLATLRRINQGSDDPAGLIAAEGLRSQLRALEAASTNAGRAVGLIETANSALAQVGDLLSTIRGQVIEAAGGGLGEAEVRAKQAQVDAALESINRIGNSTTFVGRKLLDGETFTFLLSPDVHQTAQLQLPEVDTGALGGPSGTLSDLATGGSASLAGGDAARAIEIIDAAQQQVLDARSRAGAFQSSTIETSQRLIDDTEVALSGALSRVLDADVATAVSGQVRASVLFEAGLLALRKTAERRAMAAELVRGL